MDGADRVGQLINRTGAGERRAFSDLVAAQGARLYGLCLHLAPDGAAALTLYERGWEAIWNAAPDFARSGLEGGDWLVLVIRELAVTEQRVARAARVRSDIERLADLPPVLGGEGALARCLARLGAEDAEAVTRALLAGESEEELAQGFGLPPLVMRARLDHALGEIDRCLGGTGQVHAGRFVLGLSPPEEASVIAEGLEDDAGLARAKARWGAALAEALDFHPQEPPARSLARIERGLFADDAGSLLRRTGLVPSLIAALIGALLLYAVSNGMFGPGADPAADTPQATSDE